MKKPRFGVVSFVRGHLLELAIVCALLAVSLSAHGGPPYVSPHFTFRYADNTLPWEDSVTAAFADFQGEYNHCTVNGGASTCWNYTNLQPNVPGLLDYIENGNPYTSWFDLIVCQTPAGGQQSCNTSHDVNDIGLGMTCPAGTSAVTLSSTGSNPTIDTYGCQSTAPTTQPPPTKCKSCVGDGIYAATGQKVQSESDYGGLPGLDYLRTYRSNLGAFSAITSSAFVDSSQTIGTIFNSCRPGYWINSRTQAKVYSCFPYISSGTNNYGLNTEDGRYIAFSGPHSSITQSADINERVSQISGNQWQVKRDDDSAEIYDSTGLLLQKTIRGGRVISYTYSTSTTPANIAPHPGLLLSKSDPFGHTLSWQYNAQGHVSQMTDPAGGVYQYTYDTIGNLTGVAYPDGTTKGYSYNESAYTGGTNLPNALTGITDENSVRFASNFYDSNGRGVGTQHAGGADNFSISYQSTSPGALATVTDPLGASRTYTFSSILSYWRDSNQTQPAASGTGTVNQIESLDANGNVSQLTDFNGNITKYTYDLSRNLEISRTEAYGTSQARTITTTWDTNWRQPDLITEPSRKTGFTYDLLGNVLTKTVTDTTVTPNVSRTWSYTYDSYGRMLSAKGPRTDLNSTTTYTYYTCTTGYQCGQLQNVTDPVGNVTTYNTYNAHGQPLTITDPNGVVTTLTYDTRARLTSRQVGTETTSFSYYPTGLLKQVTLPDTSYVLYTYDTAHRLTQIADGAGNSIQYTLDAMGNRTAEKTYDPSSVLHRTHTRAFNALNQLYQDANAAGTAAVTTTYAYDNNGNQTSISAPLTRNTTKYYDALNRLNQITDPASGNTYLGYDAEDNLLSLKDPRGLTTSYGYSGFGDLQQQTSPDTGATTNTYDSGGNLSTSTDARGAVSTYMYDAANRVASIVYSYGGVADQTLSFGYDSGIDGKGRLTSASDANHSLSFSYDAQGRVTGKGLTVGTVTKSVGYGYTNADLTALVTPSGQTVAYGYNSNHQVTSISVNGTTVLSGVTYEPFGGVNSWSWGNATSATRTFNTDGLITQIVTAGTTLGYSYDNANRIAAITDSSNSALSWTYGYDSLDRLTSGTTTSITDGWTYDGNGNRLTQTGTTAITFSVASASNQLTATTGGLVRSYTYDATGHSSAYGSYTFTYNDRGRMSSTSGSSTSYLYNALGQMIEKSGALGTTIFVQDEAGHLLGEYDGGGNLIEETIWLGDIPVVTLRPNGSGGVNIFYVHTDHLNTPRKVSRPSDNSLEWRWDADPFGTTADNENRSGLGTFVYNVRFPGQYYMAETGLSYNDFRDYDPATGRYIESDPIGVKGGVNTYAYVNDSPLMSTDPLGLCDIKIRCGRVRRLYMTVGWHCGVIGPDGREFGLSGGDVLFGLYGNANPYIGFPRDADPDQKEYAVSCKCKSCGDVQNCIQNYHDMFAPPHYDFSGPNSNTYAHHMLDHCGCSVTSPPSGARGWNYGF